MSEYCCETCGAPATGFHRTLIELETEIDPRGNSFRAFIHDPDDQHFHHHCDEHWPEKQR